MYVTYLTIYSGNKLPPFYIGSSSEEKVLNKKYHGSVESKKYKPIWNSEIKDNPHLFKTLVITKHNTREEATEKELFFQIKLGVVKSPLYINLSTARPNGFFGMDVSGKNNPMYNPSDEMRKLLSEKSKGRTMSENGKLSIIDSNKRRRKHPIKQKAFRVEGKIVQSEETKRKNANSSCLYIYLVTHPNGFEEKVKNLKQFSRDNNLNSGTMYSVANGKRKHHKKFKVKILKKL